MKNILLKNSNNLRKIWKGIKEIINIKSKNYDIPTCIQVGNNIITDSFKICNSFNEYFTSIADIILKNRKYEGNKIFYEYLKTPLSNSFVFEPSTKGSENTNSSIKYIQGNRT